MKNQLHLYTLNGGHTEVCDRDGISDKLIGYFQTMCEDGFFDLSPVDAAFKGWIAFVRVVEDTMFATLSRDGVPAVIYCVAAGLDKENETEAWKVMESKYLKFTDLPIVRSADFEAPRKPETTPWLAIALLNPIAATPDLEELEFVHAWAFLEQVGAWSAGN